MVAGIDSHSDWARPAPGSLAEHVEEMVAHADGPQHSAAAQRRTAQLPAPFVPWGQ